MSRQNQPDFSYFFQPNDNTHAIPFYPISTLNRIPSSKDYFFDIQSPYYHLPSVPLPLPTTSSSYNYNNHSYHNLAFFSSAEIPKQASHGFDQPTTTNSEQWKNEDSQPSAIVISEEHHQTAIILPLQGQHNSSSDNRQQVPQALVSPEAIQTALKEEEDAKMGYSQYRPFESYSSILELKERKMSLDSSGAISPSLPDSVKAEKKNSVEKDRESKQPSLQSKNSTEKNKKIKKPPNPYLLFNRDMRRQLLMKAPKTSVSQLSKQLGDSWKNLSQEIKDSYTKAARLLKEEHLKKHKNYVYVRRSKAELEEANLKKKGCRKNMATASERPEIQLGLPTNTLPAITLTNIIPKDPRGRKKKHIKHPLAPKHPMSAYLYYLSSVYPHVSLQFPKSKVGPISKSISKSWHAMSVEEQLPWKSKADSDKARYAREIKIYRASNDYS